MADTLQLKAFGRVDLDGTHRAVIEAGWPGAESKGGGSGARFIEVRHADAFCGCMLSEIRPGSAGRIYLDRFKQRHIQVRDGDTVTVELVEPAPSRRIALRVPSDFSKRDAVRFIGKPLVRGEKTALFTFSGETRLVVVTETGHEGMALVTPATEIRFVSSHAEDAPVTYSDIGGLGREVNAIREVVEYPFRFPELFRHLGVSPPKGIILCGPPGTGKTLIARALANETGARFYTISGPEVYSKWYGKSEENLRNIFSEAVKNAPSIVVIDELDALVPIRDKTHGDQEQRIVATFLTQMDGLREMKDVVVVGTTNRIDAIDPALRRGGRFEHEIHIGVPDAAGRLEVLGIHSRRMPLADGVDLGRIAERTTGFVGADIAALCREAAYNALRRTFPPEAFEAERLEGLERLRVEQEDFEKAAMDVPPSALREMLVEIPRASWEDVGGLEDVRRMLVENISHAAKRRDAFRKAGVRPARGILLHGPPGTGKTLLARVVASECGVNFITIGGPEIRARWLGESEERIRLLFARARMAAPCVVFFDEIDAAVPIRGRDASGASDPIVNQILSEMDGIGRWDGVFVIGATNRLEMLDPAVLRPGRFDMLVEVGLPDERGRRAVFDVHLRGKPIAPDADIDALGAATDGFSGADIAEVCRDAAWSALRDAGFEVERLVISRRHLEAAVAKVRACNGQRAALDPGAAGHGRR